MIRAAALAALACAVLLAAGNASAVNKCTDKAGKVTYQDGKCPDDARAGTVYVPPPATPATPAAGAAASGAPSGPPPQADATLAAVEDTLATWEYCSALDKDVGARLAGAFESWKKMNERLNGQVRRDGDAQERIKAGAKRLRDADRDLTPETRAARIGYCDASLSALLARDLGKP